jgi:hypothetical protein
MLIDNCNFKPPYPFFCVQPLCFEIFLLWNLLAYLYVVHFDLGVVFWLMGAYAPLILKCILNIFCTFVVERVCEPGNWIEFPIPSASTHHKFLDCRILAINTPFTFSYQKYSFHVVYAAIIQVAHLMIKHSKVAVHPLAELAFLLWHAPHGAGMASCSTHRHKSTKASASSLLCMDLCGWMGTHARVHSFPTIGMKQTKERMGRTPSIDGPASSAATCAS